MAQPWSAEANGRIENRALLTLGPDGWESVINRLMAQAAAQRAEYLTAEPFPHLIIDGAFDDHLLDVVGAEFPSLDGAGWRHWLTATEDKFDGPTDALAGPVSALFVHRLNAGPFIHWLEAATGISGLVADPQPMLHQSPRGSTLGIHVDGNQSGDTGLHRRLNLFLYLNRDWPDSYAGALEFWNADCDACVKRIAPLFNRLVMFPTVPWGYHGFIEPLNCPPQRLRRAIGLRYFTTSAEGATLGSQPAFAGWTSWRAYLKQWTIRLTPPIFLDFAIRARNRLRGSRGT